MKKVETLFIVFINKSFFYICVANVMPVVASKLYGVNATIIIFVFVLYSIV